MHSDSDLKTLKSNVRQTFRIILGLICCILFLLFVVLSTPVYLFRFVLGHVAKYVRPDLEMIICSSAIFANDLFTKRPPRSNIIVTITLQGHLPFEELKSRMVLKNWIQAKDSKTGELVYKKFQQYPYQWMGFMFWRNNFKNFNLDDHLSLHLDFGNSGVVTERELIDFNEKLLNAPFHPTRSPWELHLVHNYQNDKLGSEPMSALVLKIHHCLADGYSILTAIVEGLCEQPLNELKMPMPRYPKRSWTENMLYFATIPFSSIYELSYGFSNVFHRTPWKISDRKKEWYQLCGKSDLIPIQKIKDIKNSFGVSFTSVLISATSAAIHKNLEGKKKKGLTFEDPGSLYCLSVVPLPGHDGRLTNHAAGVLFDIPTVEYQNPVDRLRKCDAMLESTKKSIIPKLTRCYVYAFGGQLSSICKVVAKNSMVATGLSNFPSVPMKIDKGHLKGLMVDFVAGSLDGMAGAGFMILSYSNHLRFALSAEKALMSKEDVDIFIKVVTDEIEMLHRIARRCG